METPGNHGNFIIPEGKKKEKLAKPKKAPPNQNSEGTKSLSKHN